MLVVWSFFGVRWPYLTTACVFASFREDDGREQRPADRGVGLNNERRRGRADLAPRDLLVGRRG